LLTVRVNDAATIAGWDEACRILEFKMCLRDKAVGCFEGLIEDGIDVDYWDIVKAKFLESYKPKYSAKTTGTNFTDLTQKTDESVNNYTYHVQMAYKHLVDNKPTTMAAVSSAAPSVQEAKAEGIVDAFKFVKHQLFLAGLKDGIRDKVLEAVKATFNESVKAARNLETIQNDHKMSHRIAAVKTELPPDEAKEIIWEHLTEQEIKQVAAISACNNRFPPKRNNGLARNNGQAHTSSARTPTTSAGTATRRDTCKKSVSPAKETMLPWLTPKAKPMRTTTSTKSLTSPPPAKPRLSTRTPTLDRSPTSAPIII
jgi:hypothetical protein